MIPKEAYKLLSGSLRELESNAQLMEFHELQEAERQLDAIAVLCSRMSGYIATRFGTGGTGEHHHRDGVKASNARAARVRRALGFTHPRDDINF